MKLNNWKWKSNNYRSSLQAWSIRRRQWFHNLNSLLKFMWTNIKKKSSLALSVVLEQREEPLRRATFATTNRRPLNNTFTHLKLDNLVRPESERNEVKQPPLHSSIDDLTVLSWNINSWSNIRPRYRQRLILNLQASILLFQETRSHATLPNYVAVSEVGSNKINTCTLIRDHLTFEILTKRNNIIAISINLRDNIKLVAINLYISAPLNDESISGLLEAEEITQESLL